MRRTYGTGGGETRTLSGIILEAVGVLRQDLGEYGFIGLLGAVAAGVSAMVLRMLGGTIPLSLILPVVGVCALTTYAASACAVRRLEDSLQPDAARAFLEVLIRAPFLLIPFAPAFVLSGLGTFLAVQFSDNVGRWGATGILVALLVLAAMNAFQRSVFVPALFSRGTSVREAATFSRALQRSASAAIAMCWVVALLPAGIFALGGLAAGFGSFSTAVTAFVFVASMPFAAGVMSLLYAEAANSGSFMTAAQPSAPVRGGGRPSKAAERLGRHMP
ncbi:MAG TPA: hypothetical protein VIH21_09755 [Dehalococcoidia bacterium]